ncbi:ankyrin, partial [Stipitochalara longipes BDJ]
MSSLQGGNRVQGLIRCESCPKSFAVRGQYNRHRKTHTKPYRCGHCEEGFALRNDLDRHKTKHGGQVDTKFYCKWPNCPFKGASRRDNLLRHIHNAHGWKSATESQNIQAKARAVYQKCLKEQKASTERLSFMKSVQSGNVSMVTLLLQNGADIAERNDIGQTSLHIAVANGNSEMIQVLLNAGIDIEGMDNDNKTALYYATRTGNEAIIQILIRHGAGASIVKRNKNGSTMLHDISASGDEVTLRLLVDRQVELDTDIDTADNEKMTALYR